MTVQKTVSPTAEQVLSGGFVSRVAGVGPALAFGISRTRRIGSFPDARVTTEEATLGEHSPFPRATMLKRLATFLAAYGSVGGTPFEAPPVLATAGDRLEAIATWAEEHVRRNSIRALESHPAMYRRHARWLRLCCETI